MSRRLNVRVFLLLAAFLAASLGGGVAPPSAVAQSKCSFKGKLKLSPEALMLDSDPVRGNPSADVLLIEFFDPNCTPCQQFNPIVDKLLEKYGDRIRFYMHPIPAWQYSVRQITAMLLAKERGKYYEMIDLQLENPEKRGMGIETLTSLADSLGIDPDWMRRGLQRKAMKKQVGRLSYQAKKAGVRNTPTFAIGRKIVSPSQPPSCLGRLVERTLQETASE